LTLLVVHQEERLACEKLTGEVLALLSIWISIWTLERVAVG